MPDAAHLQKLIETAVERALGDARSALSARVFQEIAPALGATERVAAAVRTIEAAHAQTDILGTLLTGCTDFSTRCAIFVARGANAALWQAHGFELSAIRGVSAQITNGLGAMAMQSLMPVQGDANEFDPNFVTAAGSPFDGKCIVLPLMVRDKVAALVYADGGLDGSIDPSALEILVRAAGNRIEIAATRKPQSMAANASSVSAPGMAASAPVVTAPVPVAIPQVVPPPPPPVQFTAPVPASVPPPAPQIVAPASPVVQASAPTPSNGSFGDETHVKARRFAKLLVDEIKLYNQHEVAAGKRAHDLYDRLREPIEKSREAYNKRFGQTTAADADYFMHELVRGLADSNVAILGPNFPRQTAMNPV